MEKILQPYESPENTRLNAAPSVLTVRLAESPCISFPLRETVNALLSNVLATSKNVILAPKSGDAGSVAVTPPPFVLTK